MKTIVTVNTEFPSLDSVTYNSGKSLLDYDIILFDPELPYQSRIEFSGGGSCITIEGTKRLQTSMSHWLGELKDALKSGKTVFFLLNDFETDQGSTGYNAVKNT